MSESAPTGTPEEFPDIDERYIRAVLIEVIAERAAERVVARLRAEEGR